MKQGILLVTYEYIKSLKLTEFVLILKSIFFLTLLPRTTYPDLTYGNLTTIMIDRQHNKAWMPHGTLGFILAIQM